MQIKIISQALTDLWLPKSDFKWIFWVFGWILAKFANLTIPSVCFPFLCFSLLFIRGVVDIIVSYSQIPEQMPNKGRKLRNYASQNKNRTLPYSPPLFYGPGGGGSAGAGSHLNMMH